MVEVQKTMTHNGSWENIFRRQKKTDAIDKILMQIPVFQDLNNRELQIIKRILHQREYGKQEIIFSQGDVGLGMYIVVSGQVEITCDPGSHVLADLKEGDFFGELALLDDAPRSASAKTRAPGTILCFFKPEMLDIINRYPSIGCKILFRLAWTIGERLKHTNEQIQNLTCTPSLGARKTDETL